MIHYYFYPSLDPRELSRAHRRQPEFGPPRSIRTAASSMLQDSTKSGTVRRSWSAPGFSRASLLGFRNARGSRRSVALDWRRDNSVRRPGCRSESVQLWRRRALLGPRHSQAGEPIGRLVEPAHFAKGHCVPGAAGAGLARSRVPVGPALRFGLPMVFLMDPIARDCTRMHAATRASRGRKHPRRTLGRRLHQKGSAQYVPLSAALCTISVN